MHVVIDLGERYSYVACWEKGHSLDEACISVRIPGIAAFRSEPDTPLWERQRLREYLAFIYREYLIPSRLVIESAALATPDIFNLAVRRTLLDIMEEIFGLYEVNIIPHSLALAAGIRLGHPQALTGDVSIIEKRESSYILACISIIDDIGITLEKQFVGKLGTEAELHYSVQDWNPNHIILAGIDNLDSSGATFISSIDPKPNILHIDDPGFTATEGLSILRSNQNKALIPPLNVIYPYEFYLGKNGSTNLKKIPFDMLNLELNCSGRYKLTDQQSAGTDFFASGGRASFRIYELNPNDQIGNKTPELLPLPIFAIDSPLSDLPPNFELSLDMGAATLQLDILRSLPDVGSDSPEVLDQKLTSTQQKLLQWLIRNEQNDNLWRKWNNTSLLHHDQGLSLSAQIDQTLFHLYGLLQIWDNR